MPEESKSVIRIKPSIMPYTWKGIALLGLAIYVAAYVVLRQLPSPVYVQPSVCKGNQIKIVQHAK